MEERIYEIIKSWAGVSTWHTHHPMDQERFSVAMHNLITELGSSIDIECFQNALRRHASNNVDILGNPEHWDDLIDKHTINAEMIFTYESVR